MSDRLFFRNLFCSYTGDNTIFSGVSALLQQTLKQNQPVYLHSLCLSSAMRFSNQSINGIWIVLGQEIPLLNFSGPINLLASHTLTSVVGPAFFTQSKSTWVTFPKIYLAANTPISLYANGLAAPSSSRITAECMMGFTEAA